MNVPQEDRVAFLLVGFLARVVEIQSSSEILVWNGLGPIDVRAVMVGAKDQIIPITNRQWYDRKIPIHFVNISRLHVSYFFGVLHTVSFSLGYDE